MIKTKVGLVNPMFSQDAGPPIFPMELAYQKATLAEFDVSVYDLNLGIYNKLDSDIDSYHLLACVFGGYTFSYPHAAVVPFNEYPFEAVSTLELLLALVYGEDSVEEELRSVSARFGLPYDEALRLVLISTSLIESAAEELCQKEVVVVNMPSPGSVIPGILLGYNLRKLNNRVQIVGTGNQITVPEVAQLALTLGAFDSIVGHDLCAVRNTIDPSGSTRSLPESIFPDVAGFPFKDYPLYHGLAIVPLETSYGCPGRCNFCSERLFWDSDGNVVDAYVRRPIEHLMDEIEMLSRQMGVSGITFNDCLLNASHAHCDDLLSRLELTHLLYSGSLRADRLNANLIQALDKARFTSVIVGLETLSKKSVKLFNKGGDNYVDAAWEAIPSLYQNGIIPQMNVLLCHPYESLSDVRESIQAMADFAEFLEAKGIPFYDAPGGTVCINYPSAMYHRVLNDPGFKIVYHHVPDRLMPYVPSQVVECVKRVPYKAIKNTSDEEARVNKIDFCREVYQLWSKDEGQRIQLRVSGLSKHKELILASWCRHNVVAHYLGEAVVQSEEDAYPVQSVFSVVSREKDIPVETLVRKVNAEAWEIVVPALLTLSMAGIVDMSRGEQS